MVHAGPQSTRLTARGANVYEFVIMKSGTKVDLPFGDNDEGNVYLEIDIDSC